MTEKKKNNPKKTSNCMHRFGVPREQGQWEQARFSHPHLLAFVSPFPAVAFKPTGQLYGKLAQKLDLRSVLMNVKFITGVGEPTCPLSSRALGWELPGISLGAL